MPTLPRKPTDEEIKRYLELLDAERPISAVILVRDTFGVSLTQAWDYLKELRRKRK